MMIPLKNEKLKVFSNLGSFSFVLDFLKVARSLLVEWTLSLARALTSALRTAKQGARSRFAVFELDL